MAIKSKLPKQNTPKLPTKKVKIGHFGRKFRQFTKKLNKAK